MKIALIVGVVTALLFTSFISFGRYCRARGFDEGVDTTLCAFSVAWRDPQRSKRCGSLPPHLRRQAEEIGERAAAGAGK